MVFKAGEQGHQAIPLTADGRQAQQADGLEAVLDGGHSAAAVDSDQQQSSMLQSPVAHGSIMAADKRMSSAPCRARNLARNAARANSMQHTHTMAIF